MTTNTLETTAARAVRLAFFWFLLLLLSGCSGGTGDGDRTLSEAPSDEHADEHAEGEEEGRVELTQAAFDNAGLVVAEVTSRRVTAAPAMGAPVPGQVAFDPARVVLISPRTEGRVERLDVVEGDEVGAGQPLAHILSQAFLTAQADYLHAERRARLLAESADETGSRALADAAARRLSLLGADDALVARLANGGDPLDLLPLMAPFSGSIVESHTLTGAAVEAGSPVYTLADLSVVDVVAEVPERALRTLRRGQTARIELSAYPERVVEGTVLRIREELDPATRTAQAVVRVPNPERLLRPGMFASVRLVPEPEGEPVERPVLPVDAVVVEGAERYVFVETGPLTFERRDVEVDVLDDGWVAVRSGVEVGARVVTVGAFTLKSELAEGEFGGHAH